MNDNDLDYPKWFVLWRNLFKHKHVLINLIKHEYMTVMCCENEDNVFLGIKWFEIHAISNKQNLHTPYIYQ